MSASNSNAAADERPSSDLHLGKKDEGVTDAVYEAEVQAAAPQLHGRKLTAALAFVAGTGFTLFGYVLSISRVRVLSR